jgi:hypothetical protein
MDFQGHATKSALQDAYSARLIVQKTAVLYWYLNMA